MVETLLGKKSVQNSVSTNLRKNQRERLPYFVSQVKELSFLLDFILVTKAFVLLFRPSGPCSHGGLTIDNEL